MVALEGVQKIHLRMAECCIDKLVDSRNLEGILGACLIPIDKIDTNPPFSWLLLNHYSVGQPFRIKDFIDFPSLLELIDLLFTTSTCSLEDRWGCCFGVMVGFTLRWWHMNSGSTPRTSYVLQEKVSKFFFKKTNNSSFLAKGSWVPTWKNLSSSKPRTILHAINHLLPFYLPSGSTTVDCYEMWLRFRGPT